MKLTIFTSLMISPLAGAFTPYLLTKTRNADRPLFSTETEPEIKTEDLSKPKESVITANPDAEGLPFWWEAVWKLPIMERGEPGEAIIFGDSAHVLRTNIEQIFGGYPSLDGCPLAEGELADIGDGVSVPNLNLDC